MTIYKAKGENELISALDALTQPGLKDKEYAPWRNYAKDHKFFSEALEGVMGGIGALTNERRAQEKKKLNEYLFKLKSASELLAQSQQMDQKASRKPQYDPTICEKCQKESTFIENEISKVEKQLEKY